MILQNMQNASILDIAEQILREANEPISIYDLIDQVAKSQNINPDDIDTLTQLYMDITLSARFVFVGDDQWTLKEGNLEEWDKDGYAYIKHDGSADDLEDEEDLDITEFNLEDLDELEEDLDEEDLDEEVKEEKAYLEVELPVTSTDEDDFDDVDIDLDDEEYDEDDYNEIMDDYEDMYDE